MMINKRAIIWFLGMAFTFSWIMFMVSLAFKSDPARYQQMVWVFWALGMWGPGLAAILVTVFINKKPFSALSLNRLGRFHYYLAAWFLPPLVVALTIGLSVLIGTAQFDAEFTTMQTLVDQTAQVGVNMSVTTLILIQLAQGLILGPVINVLFTMGEELGWRGFLLPKLLPLGEWKALILVGIIWGLWHAPVILQGYNYPEHPVLGVLLMTIFCTFLAILIGWMYLRTRSSWSAALAHGSINAWGGLPLIFLLPGFDTAMGGSILSVTGFIILAFFIGLLVATKGLPVEVKGFEPGIAHSIAD